MVRPPADDPYLSNLPRSFEDTGGKVRIVVEYLGSPHSMLPRTDQQRQRAELYEQRKQQQRRPGHRSLKPARLHAADVTGLGVLGRLQPQHSSCCSMLQLHVQQPLLASSQVHQYASRLCPPSSRPRGRHSSVTPGICAHACMCILHSSTCRARHPVWQEPLACSSPRLLLVIRAARCCDAICPSH